MSFRTVGLAVGAVGFLALCAVLCLAACTDDCKEISFFIGQTGFCWGFSKPCCREFYYVKDGDPDKSCEQQNETIRVYQAKDDSCCDDLCPDNAGERREAQSSLDRKYWDDFTNSYLPCYKRTEYSEASLNKCVGTTSA